MNKFHFPSTFSNANDIPSRRLYVFPPTGMPLQAGDEYADSLTPLWKKIEASDAQNDCVHDDENVRRPISSGPGFIFLERGEIRQLGDLFIDLSDDSDFWISATSVGKPISSKFAYIRPVYRLTPTEEEPEEVDVGWGYQQVKPGDVLSDGDEYKSVTDVCWHATSNPGRIYNPHDGILVYRRPLPHEELVEQLEMAERQLKESAENKMKLIEHLREVVQERDALQARLDSAKGGMTHLLVDCKGGAAVSTPWQCAVNAPSTPWQCAVNLGWSNIFFNIGHRFFWSNTKGENVGFRVTDKRDAYGRVICERVIEV